MLYLLQKTTKNRRKSVIYVVVASVRRPRSGPYYRGGSEDQIPSALLRLYVRYALRAKPKWMKGLQSTVQSPK